MNRVKIVVLGVLNVVVFVVETMRRVEDANNNDLIVDENDNSIEIDNRIDIEIETAAQILDRMTARQRKGEQMST